MNERKVVVRVPTAVYTALDELARVPEQQLVNETGVTRYAELSRVLLAGELLSSAPQSVQVAAAVLSNATLILAAAFARLTYTLQSELESVSAVVSRVEREALREARQSPTGAQNRRKGPRAQPVINLTLDGWLSREIFRIAATVPSEEVRRAGFQSPVAFTISTMLEDALERPTVESLVDSYAKAVSRVRNALESGVLAEREAIREYLRAVRPPR